MNFTLRASRFLYFAKYIVDCSNKHCRISKSTRIKYLR